MMISSISSPLPFSGLSDAQFSALWDSPEGTLPTAAPWTGWADKAYGVKVRRVNLAPLFVRLLLCTYFSQTNGMYSIGGGPMLSAPYSNGVSAYYLRGTEVRLYSGYPDTNILQHTTILNQDTSFVFEDGVWKSGLTGGRTIGPGGGLGIVAAFLAARPNTNAEFFSLDPASINYSNRQQVLIVQAFIDYMRTYNQWSTNLYNGTKMNKTDPLRSYLADYQDTNLMPRVQGLYTKIGGTGGDHYPTNDVIWPPP